VLTCSGFERWQILAAGANVCYRNATPPANVIPQRWANLCGCFCDGLAKKGKKKKKKAERAIRADESNRRRRYAFLGGKPAFFWVLNTKTKKKKKAL